MHSEALAIFSPLQLWHLLSLDAPTVATLWLLTFARSAGLRLSLSFAGAMFVAVWALYAADRLLDARGVDRQPGGTPLWSLEARHLFHHRHRSAFTAGILAAVLLLPAAIEHIPPSDRHLYTALGALLCLYFVLIHQSRHASRVPKELAVSLFFAAAIFVPELAELSHGHGASHPTLAVLAVLFAGLCWQNSLTIYACEHRGDVGAHSITRAGLRSLPVLSPALVILALGCLAWSRDPAALLIALASLALSLLRAYEGALDPVTLRAAADLALATPLLLLPWLLGR